MANVKVPPFLEAPETVVGSTPQTVFPFEFPFWSDDDIEVYVDGVLLDAADYSVEGFAIQDEEAVEGGYGSGEVTLDTAVSNVTVTIDRLVVGDRETQFSRSSPLGMPALNADLNRLTARQQDLARRKLDAPVNPAAGSYLAYNASGVLIAASGTGSDPALRTDLAADSGTTLLGHDDGEDDAVLVDMATYLRNMPIYAIAYGVTPDGSDCSAALARCIAAASASGRELVLPVGTTRFNTATIAYLTSQLTYKTAFRKGLRIRGAGSGRTIIDSRVANGFWLDITVGDGSGGENTFASFAGILGGYIQGLTIINGAATTASSGIRVRAQYQMPMRDIHIVGLSGTGIKQRGSLGDTDSCNQNHLDGVRIEDCLGWGADLGNDTGFNENSATIVTGLFVQGCGTAEQKAITAITKANPAVVTCVGHGFATGSKQFIAGVSGMVEVNTAISGRPYTITSLTADTFSIDLDTSGGGFTAYTSGGHAFPVIPSSGGVRVRGQIIDFRNCIWTINKNRSVYIDGAGDGLPQDVTFTASTIENPQLIGLHANGVRLLMANGLHQYFNGAQAAGPCYWGHLYDGTDDVVAEVSIRGGCVRSTNNANEANLTVFQSIGANAVKNSIRVDPRTLHVKQFGFSGQVMFRDIDFDPVPDDCALVIASTTEVRVRPDTIKGRGRSIPVRLTYGGSEGAQFSTGPWASAALPSDGIAISNSGLPASAVIYNVYSYAPNGAVNEPDLELSTTAPVLGTDGYMVKTGDATRYWHGRVATDSGGLFVTAGGGYLNPLRIPGAQAGVPMWMWVNEATRTIEVKTSSTLPTTNASGDFRYVPRFESEAAYDPPSIAAGATVTFEITGVSCGAADDARIAFSSGWGGLTATACVKAAGTVTGTLTNNTGSTIDLPSGTRYLQIYRR